MENYHHVVGFDQARLAVCHNICHNICHNRYDGPLLTDTLQYFFVTDFVRPIQVMFKSDGQEKSTKILISWQELKNQFLSFFVHR